MRTQLLITLIFVLLLPMVVKAHAPNQSYIFLRVYSDGVGGRFEITPTDLNRALDLGLEEGLNIEDLTPHLPKIYEYYKQHVQFFTEEGIHQIEFEQPSMIVLDLGEFVQLNFTLDGLIEAPPTLNIKYDVLFDVDPTHQGLQVIEYNWKAGIHNNEANVSLIFGTGNTSQKLDLSGSSVMIGLSTMIRSGMHHIYIGLDHILFLLALLLPSVVRRETVPVTADGGQLNATVFPLFLQPFANAWTPLERFKPSFIYVLKIVTFFTLAHTITLSLAALEVIKLPSALVESIIALSIALAALHNIYPLLAKGKEWIIAFAFGLFHGFGFASVLGDLGLSGDYMVLSLVGFNIGVELGQIIIVCLIFPVLFLLRKTRIYRPILIYGSAFLILVALCWFFDRSLGIELYLDKVVEKIYSKILNKIVFSGSDLTPFA